MRWLKVLDQTKCIGCHACTTACKSENEVPVGVTRTYVKSVDVGVFPQARRAFQVTRCNQCADAPCVAACPTEAMFRREDGIVDFDKSICIGCKACMAACPYDAIFINPEDHSAEKCNMCAHRLDMGLEPACVTVCPTEAILVGDVNDPASPGGAHRGPRAGAGAPPGEGDPARRVLQGRAPGHAGPARGAPPGRRPVRLGHPGRTGPAARHLRPPGPADLLGRRAALLRRAASRAVGLAGQPLHLDQEHRGGRFRASRCCSRRPGYLGWGDPLVRWAAPALALVFLAVTGALLIWDLKHPLRFYLIFTRHHWRSWLVRGSFIIGGYGGVVALYFLAAARRLDRRPGRCWPGSACRWRWPPPATPRTCSPRPRRGTCGRARCWPPHLAVQAVLAGAAAILPVAVWLSPGRAVTAVEVVLAAAAAAHVLLVAGEVTLPHVTAHAHLATRRWCAAGSPGSSGPAWSLVAVAVAAPWIGVAAAPLALAGLLAHEHAYVQAGQSVPLA